MGESCLASLNGIFQNRPIDPQHLEVGCEKTAGEPIHLGAGGTIRVDAALCHCSQLRPRIRSRLDRFIFGRFGQWGLTHDDASRDGGPAFAPFLASESDMKAEWVHEGMTQSVRTKPRPSDPIEKTSPQTFPPSRRRRFESEPFDRFLQWVSSLLRILR
jgi:hypothetical protein